ncbi:MAG TPA: ammonium transporter [Cyclobacteriaceae bacterium]|nr:ammonium transporter [Cyclobacteriaceae bacterium]HMV09985.1 ammonium transporter [Cyclobacteriaceae bacterium]HMV89823.1 ammonium transporter [Cyclobacteriaceae bacterium]HMX01576.1 ammonium transporter [Cyclobacteriaceae bacterium]HMX50730.1 ammonium transporter [Cyclobacteriaceae bacterium]
MKKSLIPFILLIGVSILALFIPAVPGSIVTEGINAGDTAWMLAAAALVLLMTPGLAYFYGGMIDTKNIISTMLQSFIAMGVISVVWIVVGFSLAFGTSKGGFIGDPTTFFMFKNVLDGAPWALAPTIPLVLFAFFQLKFAIITPALITGTFAERINFKSYIIFLVLFSLFIYAPLAHWTWHPDGFLFKWGVLDFAGGTVVHMSAGFAALAASIYLRNKSEEKVAHAPANVPFVLLGTGLLWFGWFGFNAGSALGANPLAASAFATTNTASAAAGLCWVLLDAVRGKKLSALGFCIGAVVGLVAITPAAGFVTIPSSLFIGTIAAIVSNVVVHWKAKTSLEDTLDVFPCHGVGGLVGMIMTALLATQAVNGANTTGNGLFFGETTLFFVHMKALVIVVGFTFLGSLVLLKITDLISPLRLSAEDKKVGADFSQHGETLYPAQ